jgi:uncharacterized coiled-coil protein SlyX
MDDFMKSVKENWIVLAFIVSLIVTWTQFQSRINSLESRMTISESKLEQTMSIVQNINVSLAQIQTTLDFIKNQVK